MAVGVVCAHLSACQAQMLVPMSHRITLHTRPPPCPSHVSRLAHCQLLDKGGDWYRCQI